MKCVLDMGTPPRQCTLSGSILCLSFERTHTSKHGRQQARLAPAGAPIDACQRPWLYGEVDA